MERIIRVNTNEPTLIDVSELGIRYVDPDEYKIVRRAPLVKKASPYCRAECCKPNTREYPPPVSEPVDTL